MGFVSIIPVAFAQEIDYCIMRLPSLSFQQHTMRARADFHPATIVSISQSAKQITHHVDADVAIPFGTYDKRCGRDGLRIVERLPGAPMVTNVSDRPGRCTNDVGGGHIKVAVSGDFTPRLETAGRKETVACLLRHFGEPGFVSTFQ